MKSKLMNDDKFRRFQSRRRAHWDAVATGYRGRLRGGAYYHRRLEEVFKHLVMPGQRVLEIGCGDGDLLAAVEPRFGVGVDFSVGMLNNARRKHPDLHFALADAHLLPLDVMGEFDVVIVSDLLNDLWDVQEMLCEIAEISSPRTRIFINSYNLLWGPILRLASRLGFARPNLEQNWLSVRDVANLAYLADLEVIRQWDEVLWPFSTPILEKLINRFLVRFWPFSHGALASFTAARTKPGIRDWNGKPSVSIIVPARNEAGNISQIFERTPDLGRETELIFVEGHSKDDTYETIEREIARHPERKCKLLRQRGEGKGDAVRDGFEEASGEILFILDADLTVPPEDLGRFFDVLVSGKGDFANGVRMVYPMEDKAMQFMNSIGNKFFSLAFSWVLGQQVKDTLCGTKVLWKRDYEIIALNRSYFGDFDPFGDFDLLLGAARINLKITDVPIRYRERTYGSTNIHRWRHGVLLFRMLWIAARKIKFI
jgi:SAM-dependent methyltransferase